MVKATKGTKQKTGVLKNTFEATEYPANYTDPHGTVVYTAKGRTRSSRGTYVRCDGRRVTNRQLFKEEQRKRIGNHSVSTPAVVELVKGLVLSDPGLYSEKADIITMEVAYQCAKCSTDPTIEALSDWMDENRDMLAVLCRVMQFRKVARAASIIRNHDEDIKQQLADKWNDWRDVFDGAVGNQDLRDERKARTIWSRMASQAVDRVAQANRIKDLAPRLQTPTLAVTKTSSHTALTSEDIADIEDDDRYAARVV